MGMAGNGIEMITGIIIAAWIFGVCAILYGSTLLYWAWHSPEDADAAKVYITVGMAAVSGAIWLMNKI